MVRKFRDKNEALRIARQLGDSHIVLSYEGGHGNFNKPIYYVETGDDRNMIRTWETLVYPK